MSIEGCQAELTAMLEGLRLNELIDKHWAGDIWAYLLTIMKTQAKRGDNT